jgi:hypothetical protein
MLLWLFSLEELSIRYLSKSLFPKEGQTPPVAVSSHEPHRGVSHEYYADWLERRCLWLYGCDHEVQVWQPMPVQMTA